jgi:large subunit ribosomal protein L23
MALFSKDNKAKGKIGKNQHATAGAHAAKNAVADGRHHTALQAPWLSEKALIGTESGVYVFKVPTESNKYEIAAAVESIYNVTPVKVNIVNLPAKTKSLRTRRGTGSRAARHKAYVYLKKGDTIQF